jgi:hypothetical protein
VWARGGSAPAGRRYGEEEDEGERRGRCSHLPHGGGRADDGDPPTTEGPPAVPNWHLL